MTSTPHDALFKYVFEQAEHAAKLFRHRLPPALAELIPWDRLTREPTEVIGDPLDAIRTDPLQGATTAIANTKPADPGCEATGPSAKPAVHGKVASRPGGLNRASHALNLELLIEDFAHISNDELKARGLGALVTSAICALRDASDPEALVCEAVFWAEQLQTAWRRFGESRATCG